MIATIKLIKEKVFNKTILAVIIVNSINIATGMGQGFSAILLPQLESSREFNISKEEESWLASLGVILNPLGALSAGILMQFAGRRYTLLSACVPFFVGWIIISLSNSLNLLYLGRLLSGVGMGMASAAYVYISEISPSHERGLYSSFGPTGTSFGVLIVYFLGYLIDWRTVAAICAVTTLHNAIFIFLMPETPSWLVSRGRQAEAMKSLLWFRRNEQAAKKELDDIVKYSAIQSQLASKKSVTIFNIFRKSTVWKPTVILIAFFVLQQGSGIYIMLFYSVTIFQSVNAVFNPFVDSIIVSIVRLLTCIVGSGFILAFNRKRLVILSSSGMFISMMCIFVYGNVSRLGLSPQILPWFPELCLLVNISFSMFGTLQLPWIMIGELYPLAYRGIMGGFISSIGYALIFIHVKVFPTLSEVFSIYTIFLIYAFFSFISIIFGKMYLPETKDKELYEIQNIFRKARSTSPDVDVEKCNRLQVFTCDLYVPAVTPIVHSILSSFSK